MHGILIVLGVIVMRVNSQMAGFDEDCLKSHNEHRARHGTPPLVWSQALADLAQDWANSLANRNVFEHDLNYLNQAKQGENLAFTLFNTTKCMTAGQTNCITCSRVVKDWYSQIKNYDFFTGRGTGGGPTNVFTQIVWRTTREIGVGTANSQKYGLIVVARYFPRGNVGWLHNYIDNVPFPIYEKTNTPSYPPHSFPAPIPPPIVIDRTPKLT